MRHHCPCCNPGSFTYEYTGAKDDISFDDTPVFEDYPAGCIPPASGIGWFTGEADIRADLDFVSYRGCRGDPDIPVNCHPVPDRNTGIDKTHIPKRYVIPDRCAVPDKNPVTAPEIIADEYVLEDHTAGADDGIVSDPDARELVRPQ